MTEQYYLWRVTVRIPPCENCGEVVEKYVAASHHAIVLLFGHGWGKIVSIEQLHPIDAVQGLPPEEPDGR